MLCRFHLSFKFFGFGVARLSSSVAVAYFFGEHEVHCFELSMYIRVCWLSLPSKCNTF